MIAGVDLHASRHWAMAGGLALVAHGGAAALALSLMAHAPQMPIPDPVVLVELPADTGPVASEAPQPEPQPVPVPQPTVPPRVEAPQVRMPLPRDPVVLPPPAEVVRQVQPLAPPAFASAASAVPAATRAPSPAAAGGDAKATPTEIDYLSLVKAHLNRKKHYPSEAKKARQQGIVTVRFTVDREGNVSGVSIKRSSGHELLDRATLDLLARVAPLPRMPKSITRDSILVSLPIDYSLRTS